MRYAIWVTVILWATWISWAAFQVTVLWHALHLPLT